MPELPHSAIDSKMSIEGPTGMQLHLMSQLEGLERSVKRVEQQVSSTKHARRRLKTAAVSNQVFNSSYVTPCLLCMHLYLLTK